MLGISTFTETINKEGFARPNLFIVEIGGISREGIIPSIKGAINQTIAASLAGKDVMGEFDKSKLSLYVRSVNIPGSTISTEEYKSDRAPIDIPTEHKYSGLKITFMCDPAYKYRQYFTEWMNKVIDPVEMQTGFYDEYVSTVSIKTFDVKGKAVSGFEYVEVYPISISDIELDYDESAGLVTFEVGFTYRYQYDTSIKSTMASLEADISAGITGAQELAAGTDFEQLLNSVSKFARGASKMADTFIGRPLQVARNVQGLVSNTINKVATPIAKVKSYGHQATNVVPGAKKLLNILKR